MDNKENISQANRKEIILIVILSIAGFLLSWSTYPFVSRFIVERIGFMDNVPETVRLPGGFWAGSFPFTFPIAFMMVILALPFGFDTFCGFLY